MFQEQFFTLMSPKSSRHHDFYGEDVLWRETRLLKYARRVEIKPWTSTSFLVLPAGVSVSVPLVLCGPHDEVLGALVQDQSVSAASMRHEKPPLAHFNSCLYAFTFTRYTQLLISTK